MKNKVEQTLTLSKYDFGNHSLEQDAPGRPCFLESLNAIDAMIVDLYNQGVPIGSKIKITMEVVELNKK